MRIKKFILLSIMGLFLCTHYAVAWDEDFDFDTPAGTAAAGQLDTFIQEFKKGIAERLNQDHWFPEDNVSIDDLTAGYHRHVTLTHSDSAPSTYTGAGHVYSKYDGNDVELFYQDNNGNSTQMTKDNALNITGSISVSDIAVSNDITIGDILSVNGNTLIGGTVNIGGTLTVTGVTGIDSDFYVNGETLILGSLETTDVNQIGGSTTALAVNTEYQAAVDGCVSCIDYPSSGVASVTGFFLYAYTSSGVKSDADIIDRDSSDTGNRTHGVNGVIRAGEYWYVERRGSKSYHLKFRPFKRD